MEESNKRRATQAAERLRDLAEDKFKAGDTNGARTMALKAQVIFPSLPGLSGMIAAFDVHIAAATRKLSTGRVDWYAVLGMSETCTVDANIIKKQLKKMRLLTHPDKNCSAASTGAFRLVQEAGQSILKSSAVHSMRAGKRFRSNDDNEKAKRARRNDDGDQSATMAGQQQRREHCIWCPPLELKGVISEKNRRALGCRCPHERTIFDL